jgi:hypothetical protein
MMQTDNNPRGIYLPRGVAALPVCGCRPSRDVRDLETARRSSRPKDRAVRHPDISLPQGSNGALLSAYRPLPRNSVPESINCGFCADAIAEREDSLRWLGSWCPNVLLLQYIGAA